MDTIARVALANRQSPQALGSAFRSSLRPAADARVDVPEIQESTRVSFTEGAAVAPSAAIRSSVDLYRQVQSL
jgi:hypothetical protein